MALVAKGHVSDRPFVRTLFTIAAKRFNGDLVLTQAGAEYRIAWHRGYIAGADVPGSDGSLAERAGQVFGLADASYELHDDSKVASVAGDRPIDARWLIFHGLVTHYDDERLETELNVLASREVQISPEALSVIDEYGIEEADRPWVKRLLDRKWDVQELVDEAADDAQKRRVRALLFALLATDALRIEVSQRQPAVAVSRKQPRVSGRMPQTSGRSPRVSGKVKAQGAARQRPLSVNPADQEVKQAADLRALITTNIQKLAAGGDHFELLGLPRTATKGEVQRVYFQLAKNLHPDRISAAGLKDLAEPAQQLFARINEAFGTLGDDKKREQYVADLEAGVTEESTAEAEAKMLAILEAEERYQLGEMAMRRQHWSQALEDFGKAAELNPDEGDHHALTAWARWRDADDKDVVEKKTKQGFRAAIRLSPNSTIAYFLRGKMAKELGDNDGALYCFNKVLGMNPEHSEADLERRILTERMAGESGAKKKGLLGRKR